MNRSKQRRKPPAPSPAESLSTELARLITAGCERLETFCPSEGMQPGQKNVHEARNESRRVVALLRFFASDSRRENSAARLMRQLKNLSRSLGDARDATVWNKLLASKSIARAMQNESGWMAFTETERARERAAYEALKRRAVRTTARAALAALHRFVRDGLPGLKSKGCAAEMAASHLKIRAKRLITKDLSKRINNPVKLHDLRRKMRRLRYLADVFSAALPHKVRRMAKKLHRTEALLGKVHDLDAALARLQGDRRKPTAKLVLALARRRRKLGGRC